MCGWVKNCIVTCENLFFRVKKGMTKFWHQVAQKHYLSGPVISIFSAMKVVGTMGNISFKSIKMMDHKQESLLGMSSQ